MADISREEVVIAILLTGCLFQSEPNRFDYLNQFGSILKKQPKRAGKGDVHGCGGSAGDLVPLAAFICEKRERCRNFDFGPTTGLPVSKKLVFVI